MLREKGCKTTDAYKKCDIIEKNDVFCLRRQSRAVVPKPVCLILAPRSERADYAAGTDDV